jgi:hypothetical protein
MNAFLRLAHQKKLLPKNPKNLLKNLIFAYQVVQALKNRILLFKKLFSQKEQPKL